MIAALVVVNGLLLAWALLPPAAGSSNRVMDALAFGPLLGLGILGGLDFLIRTHSGGALSVTTLLWISAGSTVGCLLRARCAPLTELRPLRWPRWETLGFIVLLMALALAAFFMLAVQRAAPDGGWDGLAVWGLLARSLIASPGNLQATLAGIELGQPDYPLFLPEALALFSSEELQSLTRAGQWLGWIGLFSLAAIVHRMLLRLGARWGAHLALVLVLTTPLYLRLAADHYADHLVAAQNFAAVGFCLLALIKRPGRFAYLLLAGLFLGMMAWTKAEGLVLAAVIGVATLALYPGAWRGKLQAAGLLVLGLLPFILVLVVHRLEVAPSGGRLDLGFGVLGERLVDGERWALIGQALAQEVSGAGQVFRWTTGSAVEPAAQRWGYYFLALPLLIALSWSRRRWRKAMLLVPLVTVGQVVAYVLMLLLVVEELEFSLANAASRLLAQLAVIPLLAIFSDLSEPEMESEARVDDPEAAALVEG